MDETFATNGEFTYISDAGNDYALDALVIENGSIFITGYLSNDSNVDMLLIELTQDGVLDTSFNETGYIIRDNIAGRNGSDIGTKINRAPDGDLLISGYSDGAAVREGVLWKVSTSSADDASFGSSGTFTLNVGDVIPDFNAKYDDFTGNIFITGYCLTVKYWL